MITNSYLNSSILIKILGEHISKYISSKNIDINNSFTNP